MADVLDPVMRRRARCTTRSRRPIVNRSTPTSTPTSTFLPTPPSRYPHPSVRLFSAGIILGGLVDLFSTTKNQTYLDIANNIAFHAIGTFSNGQGIMRETCEHDGPLQDDDNGGLTSAGESTWFDPGWVWVLMQERADGTPKNNLPAGCQNDNIMVRVPRPFQADDSSHSARPRAIAVQRHLCPEPRVPLQRDQRRPAR